MGKPRVTMQDIANKVGITKMTVSRYFNAPHNVAKATGDKIRQAVDFLGFVPSRVPAMLAQSSSKAIGAVIPSFSNMVFADVIRGIEKEAQAHNYTVLIMHSGYNMEAEERQIAELLSYQIDGIILTEPQHTDLTRRRLNAMNVPCAETMSLPAQPIDMAAGLDHREAMYRCTKTLLEQGRRQPIYIGVRMDIRTWQRQEGYEQAMREYGLTPFIMDSCERSTFTMAGSLMREALKSCPKLDAVLCTNDDVAVGTLLACQALKLRVPEDTAILGYNGLNIGSATVPQLCSIATPRVAMGRMAVRLLLERFNAQEPADASAAAPQPRRIKLPYCITGGQTVTAAELAALRADADLLRHELTPDPLLPEQLFEGIELL